MHYVALPTVTSASHQTAELQANILAVSAYDTLATGHELHEAKMAIITNCLLADFTHSCIAGSLLALVHSTEPARFNSQCVQPGDLAIHPICARNRVKQTPIVWHRISVRFNYVRPTGGTGRTSKKRKQCCLCRIWNISCV